MKSYSDKSKLGKWLERMRFRIAFFLDRSEKHCWADLAMFGMGYNKWDNLTKCTGTACKKESEDHQTETCYCGKFWKGQRVTDEIIKQRDIDNPKSDEGNDFPF